MVGSPFGTVMVGRIREWFVRIVTTSLRSSYVEKSRQRVVGRFFYHTIMTKLSIGQTRILITRPDVESSGGN